MTDTHVGSSGYTVEEIADYFDRGRAPTIAAIERDPEAQALLDSMEHLRSVTRRMIDEDIAASPAPTDEWFDQLLGVIRSEFRAGRDLSLDELPPHSRTTITEGSLREIARRAGDTIDGTLIGRVRLALHGTPARLDVHVTIAVEYGQPLHERAALVRTAVAAALAPHAPTPLGEVDVTITDTLLLEETTDD